MTISGGVLFIARDPDTNEHFVLLGQDNRDQKTKAGGVDAFHGQWSLFNASNEGGNPSLERLRDVVAERFDAETFGTVIEKETLSGLLSTQERMQFTVTRHQKRARDHHHNVFAVIVDMARDRILHTVNDDSSCSCVSCAFEAAKPEPSQGSGSSDNWIAKSALKFVPIETVCGTILQAHNVGLEGLRMPVGEEEPLTLRNGCVDVLKWATNIFKQISTSASSVTPVYAREV